MGNIVQRCRNLHFSASSLSGFLDRNNESMISGIEYQKAFHAAASPMAIIEPRPDFRVLDATDSFFRETHTTREYLIGRPLLEVFIRDTERGFSGIDLLEESLNRVISTKKPDCTGFIQFRLPTGSYRFTEMRSYEQKYYSPVNTPVFDDSGNIHAILHRSIDVTEVISKAKVDPDHLNEIEKRFVELNSEVIERSNELSCAVNRLRSKKVKLEEALHQTERVSKARTDFFANISHEMRTPLNAIIGFSQLLESNLALTGEALEYVQSISAAGTHLLTLINDLLDMAKISSGKLKLSPVTTDVSKLINDTSMLFLPTCIEKNLILKTDLDDLPPSLIVDPVRLRQMIMNVMGNAVKFTEQGEVKLSSSWKDVGCNKVLLAIEIADTGPGIPEYELANLFERFQQGETKRACEGTGLGLTITRELARLMGGDVLVDSEVGVGSTFTIHVVLPQGSQDELNPEDDSKKLFNVCGPKVHKILVVDEVSFSRRVISAQLKQLGFNVILEAPNPEVALKIAESDPDLEVIFMDLQMPSMSGGIKFAHQIRQVPGKESIQIIGITACLASEWKDQRELAIFNTILTKPVSIQQIREALELYCQMTFEERIPLKDKSIKVLIVDDQAFSRRLTGIALSKEPWIGKLDQSPSGRDALLRLQEEKFDVVLIDRLMPGMSGPETCARIKAQFADAPTVIIMSADMSDFEAEECSEAGADAILIKPVKGADFAQTLEDIDRKRLRQDHDIP